MYEVYTHVGATTTYGPWNTSLTLAPPPSPTSPAWASPNSAHDSNLAGEVGARQHRRDLEASSGDASSLREPSAAATFASNI